MADTDELFGVGKELSEALSQYAAINLPETDEVAFDVIPDCSHQLVVLGNGFDLQCKLKSRYSDFYEEQKLQKVRDLLSSSDVGATTKKEAGTDDRLTVWDLILYRTVHSNWCDIEAVIANWVTNTDIVRGISPLDVGSLVDKLCKKKDKIEQKEEESGLDFGALCSAIKTYIFESLEAEWDPKRSKEIFLGFLMRELHTLERQFNEYLEQKVNATNYGKISAEYLKIILENGVNLDEEDEEINYSVLDFNYTTPFTEKGAPFGNVNVVNVHGRLGSEIVFGIDGRGYMDNPLIAPFTKTYRLLSMRREPLGELIEIPSGSPLDKGTAVVKFYGHSLGAADYSYFQAIFDALDIYSGSTELIFYYNPVVEMRSKKVDAVTRLLNTYGETLDNQDHGKNLMHKLLLEGRLTVRPLKFPDLQDTPL